MASALGINIEHCHTKWQHTQLLRLAQQFSQQWMTFKIWTEFFFCPLASKIDTTRISFPFKPEAAWVWKHTKNWHQMLTSLLFSKRKCKKNSIYQIVLLESMKIIEILMQNPCSQRTCPRSALHARCTTHYSAWIWDIELDQYMI